MFNSDLNWLPNSILKDLQPMKIVYEPYNKQIYGGYYTQGTDTLVIVEPEDESTVASTIAHELKHHIQFYTGTKPGPSSFSTFSSLYSYEESIYRYFTSYWWEYEALLFEYKYSKDWCNEWWLKKLVHKN